MSFNDIKKKISVGTIGIWIVFAITTFIMIILLIGKVFPSYDFWIPFIPIGVLLVIAIMATTVDLKSERRRKVGIAAMWTISALTTVVMIALIIGVFEAEEYWIPAIPIGSTFVIAISLTILEYTSGNVKFCPKCGKNIVKKWDFCQECGTRVLMTCPSCGIKVKGNPKFCHKCGTNLSEIEFDQLVKAPPKYKLEKNNHFCDNCGAPSGLEAKYCGYCGSQN